MKDESTLKLARSYAKILTSLLNLRDVRKGGSEGAVLAYVSTNYENAREALDYLKSKDVPKEIREGLEISKLEEELMNFGNTHIVL